METIREIINKALAQGDDVLIADDFCTLERLPMGNGWYVPGEFDWISTEEEVDQLTVTSVERLEEGITIINVVTTNWG